MPDNVTPDHAMPDHAKPDSAKPDSRRSDDARDAMNDTAAWKTLNLDDVLAGFAGRPVEYHEALRVPSLSCGVYRLAAGSRDMQGPHDEDEVYYVVTGRARLKVGDETRAVGPGSILYVRATERHSFFEIDEDMTLLVFFAASRDGERG